MENYIEQSVSGRNSFGKSVLYVLCWCMTILLTLLALIFGAGVFGDNAGAFEINWLNVIALLACLILAFVFFRCKDRMRIEYDYLLQDDSIEVCAIMNARRRRLLARIPLDRIAQIGPAHGAGYERLLRGPDMKRHNWFLNSGNSITYLIYMIESTRHMALLEMSDEFIGAVRANRKLSKEAWRNEEGKSSNYASLS